MMHVSNKEIGNELKFQIKSGFDVVKISRWAYKLIYDKRDQLDSDITEILKDISIMEDDPQFEYTEKELEFIANVLIDNEYFKNKIKRLSDVLTDPQYSSYWKTI